MFRCFRCELVKSARLKKRRVVCLNFTATELSFVSVITEPCSVDFTDSVV